MDECPIVSMDAIDEMLKETEYPESPLSEGNPSDKDDEYSTKPVFSNNSIVLPASNANVYSLTLRKQYADIIASMKELYEVLKNQENVERQILDTETECYFHEINDDRDVGRSLQIDLILLYGNLQEVKAKKAFAMKKLVDQRVQDVRKNTSNTKEKHQLDLMVNLIGSMEKRFQYISIERKNLHVRLREMKKKQTQLINSPENSIWKEPATSNGSADTSQNHNNVSPPEVPVKKFKIQRQKPPVDRTEPVVDRPSTSHTSLAQAPNVVSTNRDIALSAVTSTPQRESSIPMHSTPASNDVVDNSVVGNSLTSEAALPQNPIEVKTNSGQPQFMCKPTQINVPYRGLTGLENSGNYSYINSMIQCVSNTPSVAKYFWNDTWKNDTKKSRITEEFAYLMKGIWSAEHPSLSPNKLKAAIERYEPNFDTANERDPGVFLTFLLESLHNDLKKVAKVETKLDFNSHLGEREWITAMNGQRSIISDLFFGQMRTTTICDICKNANVSYSNFSRITIPLPDFDPSISVADGRWPKLHDLLDKYLSEYSISNWACSRCGVACNATKKTVLSKLGPVVVIQLERFRGDGQMNCLPLNYTLNKLYLQRFLVPNPDEQSHHYKYRLYAVCVHNEFTKSDCYFADCKSPTQFRWHKFHDELVADTTAKQLTKYRKTCCILFYRSFPGDPEPVASNMG